MRQIFVRVPHGQGQDVLDVVRRHGGMNVTVIRGSDGRNPVDLVLAHVPNDVVGTLAGEIESMAELHFSMIPSGALVLSPPASRAPEQVRDVGQRSSLEVYLAGLQSVGSWRGFLAFAAAAGAVVWLGLLTNTVYLLVAAMLLAPFGSPALNAAIGTARGDLRLIGRSIARYVAAIGLTVLVCAVLSVVFDLRVETELMADVSSISGLAVLLPIVAGVAGGLHLIQGERNSLVSGAAVGILVAASLAPPAGIIGMAAAIGRWEMVADAAFLVALQLAGINLAASLLFRLYGLGPAGPRYRRGRESVARGGAVVAAVGVLALLAVQFVSPQPFLVRASMQHEARAIVVETVAEQFPEVMLANADVRFTRADIPGQQTLLVVMHVQPAEGTGTMDEHRAAAELAERVTAGVGRAIVDAGLNVTPLVDVRIVRPPAP